MISSGGLLECTALAYAVFRLIAARRSKIDFLRDLGDYDNFLSHPLASYEARCVLGQGELIRGAGGSLSASSG